MGDRISIQFKNGADESPILFSHWDGRGLLSEVKAYYKQLKKDIEKLDNFGSGPLERYEAGTVMVDFIQWLAKKNASYHRARLRGKKAAGTADPRDVQYHKYNAAHISGNYYIEASQENGDNSDNGHFVFDLVEGDFSY